MIRHRLELNLRRGYDDADRIQVAWDRDCWLVVLNVVTELRFTNAPYSSLPELQNWEMKIFRVKSNGFSASEVKLAISCVASVCTVDTKCSIQI
jgi:hypothetical protein